MKGSELKVVAEAAKAAGGLLPQISDFVDSIADDFEDGRWVRGSAKTACGGAVAAIVLYGITKFAPEPVKALLPA